MKIYLLGKLLVESRIFENPFKEQQRREFLSNLQREWNIYLWNCKDKLSSKNDGTSSLDYKTIEARLVYANNLKSEFEPFNISNPEKILFISGYSSFIETPKKTIMEIVRQLEKAEIDCLVDHKTAPIFMNYDYASPEIERKLKNSVRIENILL